MKALAAYQQRPRPLSPRMVRSRIVALFLLSILHKATAFTTKPGANTVLSVERTSEEFCRQTGPNKKIQCWILPRLSYQTSSTRSGSNTRLSESTQVESSVINGDSGLDEAQKTIVLNGSSSPSTNGVNGSSNGSVNGGTVSFQVNGNSELSNGIDVPIPTENGGFTHTAASRAKIGAANKGKTPWNKGKARSEEVKARIAAGVRARNRERFLQKLKDMGMTEEEYEQEKKEERRKKDAERRARRTAKGGYTPTEETKAKISKILKEKYSKGEIKPRKVDPNKVRKGFKQSAETRAKISESLKKRWATDPEYREKMKNSVSRHGEASEQVRQRISQTLKNKWKDPEFRASMMEKMANRTSADREYTALHREKISQSMKKKWQDKEYREKALKSIAKRQVNRPPSTRKRTSATVSKPRQPRASKGQVKGSSASKKDGISLVQPVTAMDRAKKKKVVRKKKKKIVKVLKDPSDVPGPVAAVKQKSKGEAKKAAKKKTPKKKKEPDGSVNRLREERRDLFDLLYGDEAFDDEDDDDDDDDNNNNSNFGSEQRPKSALFGLEDEDLDSFDPYGLDDY